MGRASVAKPEIVFHINNEKHTLDQSHDLTQSLNDYLRRKTRFKVGHALKPSCLGIHQYLAFNISLRSFSDALL